VVLLLYFGYHNCSVELIDDDNKLLYPVFIHCPQPSHASNFVSHRGSPSLLGNETAPTRNAHANVIIKFWAYFFALCFPTFEDAAQLFLLINYINTHIRYEYYIIYIILSVLAVFPVGNVAAT